MAGSNASNQLSMPSEPKARPSFSTSSGSCRSKPSTLSTAQSSTGTPDKGARGRTSLLNFLSVKEPSAKALADFEHQTKAAAMSQQNRPYKRGDKVILSGVSSAKLPAHARSAGRWGDSGRGRSNEGVQEGYRAMTAKERAMVETLERGSSRESNSSWNKASMDTCSGRSTASSRSFPQPYNHPTGLPPLSESTSHASGVTKFPSYTLSSSSLATTPELTPSIPTDGSSVGMGNPRDGVPFSHLPPDLGPATGPEKPSSSDSTAYPEVAAGSAPEPLSRRTTASTVEALPMRHLSLSTTTQSRTPSQPSTPSLGSMPQRRPSKPHLSRSLAVTPWDFQTPGHDEEDEEDENRSGKRLLEEASEPKLRRMMRILTGGSRM